MTIQLAVDMQTKLSEAQAIPVIGPLFVSPVKAVVSCAEVIAGFAGAIICGVGAVFVLYSWRHVPCCQKGMAFAPSFAFLVVGVDGAAGLLYSIANIATLGILGYTLESRRGE